MSGLHEEVLAHPDAPVRTGLPVAASLLMALLVDLSTLAVLVGGLWLAWLVPLRIVGFVLGLVVLGLAWELRPRLGRLPKPTQVAAVGPAPALQGVLEQIAQALGTRAPDSVLVSPWFNASVIEVGARRRRVLVIGAPLWACLDRAERIGVLAHELAHFVCGDTRRSVLVSGALGTLSRWHRLALGDPNHRRALGAVRSEQALVNLLDMVVMAVFRVLALIPLGGYYLLLAVTLRASQRAEYRADRLAGQVAGPESMRTALVKLGQAESLNNNLRRAVMAREPELLRVAEQHAFTSQAPADARASEAFASHPPIPLRIDAVEHLTGTSAQVLDSSSTDDLIAVELATAMGWAEKRLRDHYREGW